LRRRFEEEIWGGDLRRAEESRGELRRRTFEEELRRGDSRRRSGGRFEEI
jgi:hypothetical protein